MKKFDGLDYTSFEANHIALSPVSFLTRAKTVYGQRTALIYKNYTLTWLEFYEQCVIFADALRKHNIKKDDVVSIISPNTPAMILAHFAIPMAGAVLNTINMRLNSKVMAYIIDHSETKLVLVDQQYIPAVADALKVNKNNNNNIPDIIEIIDEDYEHHNTSLTIGRESFSDFIASGDKNYKWNMPKDEWQTLALNYTSGTSGNPKGVLYHHRGSYLMTFGTVVGWNLSNHPIYLATVPYFHCNGWGHAWVMAALAGTIVCQRQISAKEIYHAIDTYKVTHFGGAPIILNMLVNASDEERCKISDTVHVMTAGASPPSAILEKMQKLGFSVMQVYGLTETYGHTVHCPWQKEWDDLSQQHQAEHQARQGVCFPITEEIDIIDTDTNEILPHDGNHMGELVIKSNTIMKGYFKDANATKKAFHNGWFHSGDLAVIHPNNYCEIKDRLKDIIISGGENISSVEIESVLFHHSAVSLAAVIAIPNNKWGEVPCAFIELKDDVKNNPPSEQDIIDFSREYLAGFQVPKKVIFQTLPKTATGKIQKFLLRESVK